MADQNVSVAYDTSQLSAGVRQVIQDLSGQKDAVIQLAKVMEDYNKNGDLVKQTLVGLNSAGEQFEIRLKNVQNQLEITGSSLKKTGDTIAQATAGSQGLFNIDFSKLGLSVATTAINELSSQIKEGIARADQLSIQVARIQTIANQPANTKDSLISQLTEFGNKFGVSQIDAASAAMDTLRSTVGRTGNALEVMNSAAQLSKATGASLQETVAALTKTMDAFGITSDQSKHTADALFTLFKNSPADIGTLSGEIGRISLNAKAAGLSFNELIAAMLDLTNKGLSANQASTLLTSTFARIQAPTKEFTAVMQANGVASVDAAIKAGEFGRILQIIASEAEKGNEHFKDLVGGLRSARGFKILAEDAEGFSKSLDKVNSGLDNVAAASDRVAGSVGGRWEIIKQQVSNTFTVLGNVVNNFVSGSVTGFKIWGQYFDEYVLQKASKGANDLANFFQFGQIRANVREAVGGKSSTQLEADSRAAAEAAAAKHAEQIANEAGAKIIDDEIKALEQRKNENVKYYGEVVKEASKARDEVVKTIDQAVDATKLAARQFHDDITNNIIKDFERQASEAKSAVEAANKSLESIRDKSGSRQFQDTMKYASGGYIGQGGFIVNDQQAALTQQRIKDLYTRARTLSQSNNKDDVAEARKLYDEIDRLQQTAFDHDQANQQKIYEYKVKNGQVQPTGYDVNGNAIYQRMVNINQLEQQRNKLIAEREAMEKAAKERFDAKAKEAQEAADAEKKNQEEVTQLVQKAVTARTKYFDQSGNFKKEFDTTEKQQAAMKEIEGIFSKLSEKIGSPQALGFKPEVLVQLGELLKQLQTLGTSGSIITGGSEKSNAVTAEFEKQKAALIEIKNQFKDGIDIIDTTKVRQQFGAVDESAKTSLTELKATFNPAENGIDETLNSLREMKALIDSIGNPGSVPTSLPGTPSGAPGEMFGGSMDYMAGGGTPTHHHKLPKSYGRNNYMWGGGYSNYMAEGGYPVSWIPRGSDSQPAMIDPREFVMNAQASQAFAPVLEAMNGMQLPKAAQKAGGNVTNVGDINVTVQGGSNAPQTIQAIANGLRRELRRGTISLETR